MDKSFVRMLALHQLIPNPAPAITAIDLLTIQELKPSNAPKIVLTLPSKALPRGGTICRMGKPDHEPLQTLKSITRSRICGEAKGRTIRKKPCGSILFTRRIGRRTTLRIVFTGTLLITAEKMAWTKQS
jgi:hypothetical protein